MENENSQAQPNNQPQSQENEAFDANSVSENPKPEKPLNEKPKMENAPPQPKKHLVTKKMLIVIGIVALLLMTASVTYFVIYSMDLSSKKAQEAKDMEDEANRKMPAEVEEVEEIIEEEVVYEEETFEDPDLEFFINSFEEEDIVEDEVDGVEAALDEENDDLSDLETIYDDEDL